MAGRRDRSRGLDDEAFISLYRQNAEALLVFFTRRTLDAHLAMDLTSETFAQALVSRSNFRGERGIDAKPWLFGIARNLLAQYWRTGSAERRALERAGLETPELSAADIERVDELAETEGLRRAAQNGLVDLSENERAALKLRVVEELPYREVARRLGISEPAARTRVSRALQTLADRLDHPDQEEAST